MIGCWGRGGGLPVRGGWGIGVGVREGKGRRRGVLIFNVMGQAGIDRGLSCEKRALPPLLYNLWQWTSGSGQARILPLPGAIVL